MTRLLSLVRRFRAPGPPVFADRILVAVLMAIVYGSFIAAGTATEGYKTDLDQVWHGSRLVLEGRNPYSLVGPGREVEAEWLLLYPMPALIAFMPLGLLSLHAARVVFVVVSILLLAFAVTRDGWFRLWIFASGSCVSALLTAQWAPLMTAAFLLPWLGFLVVAKPNVGAMLVAATPYSRFYVAAAIGGGLLILASFAVDPLWVQHWLGAMKSASHFTPLVLRWGGVLILLALLRWRRPEARLLVALACIPHTPMLYESTPAHLAARGWRQAVLLAATSMLALPIQSSFSHKVDGPLATGSFVEWASVSALLCIALVYLPALIMVLRRPNEGELPAWWPLLSRPLKVIRG